MKLRKPRPEPVVAVPVTEPEPESESAGEVRTLRAQVRVLEQALERIADPPSLEEYRTQVRSAVQAVGLGTASDGDPRAAVARVSAALARIDAPTTGRVLLPPPVTVARPAVAELEPATGSAVPEAEESADAGTGTEDEIVLPVPPPAPADHRRSRRRRSPSAA